MDNFSSKSLSAVPLTREDINKVTLPDFNVSPGSNMISTGLFEKSTLAVAWLILLCTSDGNSTGHTTTLKGNDALPEALTITSIALSVKLQPLYCSDSKDIVTSTVKKTHL